MTVKKDHPYIVYWYNKRHKKWQAASTLEKANSLKNLLQHQGVFKIWIAKDI